MRKLIPDVALVNIIILFEKKKALLKWYYNILNTSILPH